MSLCIGIDLGTSNTVVYKYQDRKFDHLKFGDSYCLPSLIGYKDDKLVTGYEANNLLTSNRKCLIQYWKPCIGMQYDDAINNDGLMQVIKGDVVEKNNELAFRVKDNKKNIKDVTTKECVEFFANYLLNEICKQCNVNRNEISNLCISHPNNFTVDQITCLKQCFEKVFENCKVTTVQEPVAAAISSKCKIEDGYQLVFDMGGGTFDCTILSDKNNIIGMDGVVIGGNDIDIAFGEYLKKKYLSEEVRKRLENDKTERLHRKFLKEVEAIKKQLSKSPSVSRLYNLCFSDDDDDDEEEEEEEIEIGREEFNKAIEKVIDKVIMVVKRLVEYNECKDRIKKILLIGGSSHIPFVREKLKHFFNCDDGFFEDMNNANKAVAKGNAMLAVDPNLYNVNRRLEEEDIQRLMTVRGNQRLDIVNTDETLLGDIGILHGDNKFYSLIKKESCKGAKNFVHIKRSDPTNPNVVINFAQGVSNEFDRNRLISSFRARNLTPDDVDLILGVEYWDDKKIEIILKSGDKEIEGETINYPIEAGSEVILLTLGNASEDKKDKLFEEFEEKKKKEAEDYNRMKNNDVSNDNLISQIKELISLLEDMAIYNDHAERLRIIRQDYYFGKATLLETHAKLKELEKDVMDQF